MPVVYAADSVALAVLEVRVHLNLPWDLIPVDYVVVTIDTGTCSLERVTAVPSDTAAFGDLWLSSRRSCTLGVPSIIAPDSTNLLINPMHAEAADVFISGIEPITLDRRLWPLT